MEKISVTVITRNEEKNIERCLKSLAWADEIVVLDNHSTDKTVEICRKYTDHVETFDWHGYGKQKNLCADHLEAGIQTRFAVYTINRKLDLLKLPCTRGSHPTTRRVMSESP
jgi:glycosyltransferase involved in cell wall biosynthesis